MAEHRGSRHNAAESRMALFDFAFDHAPIGIALVDLEGRVVRGNTVFSRMVGIPLPELSGTPFKNFTHPDDIEADLALFHEVLAGKRDGYTIEKRYVQPSGEIVHVRIHVAAMRMADGQVAWFISQIEDISRDKENERALAERAAQLELAMQAIRGGFWHMDLRTRKFETSDRLAQFIGGPAAARLDLESYTQRVHRDDSDSADLTSLINGSVDQSVAEYRLKTAAGERWMRCDRRLLRDTDGNPWRIVGVAIDFTDEHQRLEYLEHNSETDALTGLLNRRGLERGYKKLASAEGYSLLAIDLDGFKSVNDQYGHPAGDAVLMETSKRLAAAVRSGDLVCRTGGDEFILVVAGDAAVGEAVARRAVETMRAPFILASFQAVLGASVGGVWAPDKQSIDHLIAQADGCLYKAKADGKNSWRFRTS
jgi:diguanylate cyclase (GGDEF)-like protein/PAS domain S-box-containing protein